MWTHGMDGPWHVYSRMVGNLVVTVAQYNRGDWEWTVSVNSLRTVANGHETSAAKAKAAANAEVAAITNSAPGRTEAPSGADASFSSQNSAAGDPNAPAASFGV